MKISSTLSRSSIFLLLSLTLLASQARAQAPQEMTGERLAKARKEPQNWPTYFGAYDAWRYSPLDQIRADNVKNLVPVWAFQTGKIDGGLNATPIVIDGIMYLIASEDRVFALNAELDLKSGAKRKEVDAAMKGHVIGQGQLMGKYSKK